MAMPRWDGVTLVTSTPSMLSVPPLTVSNPEMHRSRVDLPQPDGPTKTTNSPDGMSRFTFLRMSKAPKRLSRLLIVSLANCRLSAMGSRATTCPPSAFAASSGADFDTVIGKGRMAAGIGARTIIPGHG